MYLVATHSGVIRLILAGIISELLDLTMTGESIDRRYSYEFEIVHDVSRRKYPDEKYLTFLRTSPQKFLARNMSSKTNQSRNAWARLEENTSSTLELIRYYAFTEKRRRRKSRSNQ
jgi:hypothetical protein